MAYKTKFKVGKTYRVNFKNIVGEDRTFTEKLEKIDRNNEELLFEDNYFLKFKDIKEKNAKVEEIKDSDSIKL